MKHIQLTKGQVAIVDDDDFGRLVGYRWCVNWNKDIKSFYAVRSTPMANWKRQWVSMHREIIDAKTGEFVDHINHDTLDNRKENLRVCSSGQNSANRRRRVDNTSGFKGVSWHYGICKWRSRLMVNSKPLHIGYFQTANEAAIAYDKAAFEHYGEFALTNKMLGLIPGHAEIA